MGLALKPRLLILDEPTQGLSDGEIDDFIALVREIARDATVLLIEHNMPVVMELADRITVLERRHASWPKARRSEIRANAARAARLSRDAGADADALDDLRARLLLWRGAGAATACRCRCAGARCSACSAATAPARRRR